ncbi:helix-turn-helix domain-containing protein [Leucobacter denitrificans]|uniref:Helix-turn-helix domain-containing protein n=1 Tax=Leucobacter denitrificans TaxID=683042 RepID=A0A7G9S265_9MICO|nr:helix-turn-helix domain-containing protein [Leucobacter denitrificans]QNN61940.1 helix-turn-helix domain-containing protein [Leucobacter denitrificans]
MTQGASRLRRQVRSPRGMGAFVAERREYLGLTQQELADRALVSRSWVARFERDGSSAVLYRVMDVLSVLGVSIYAEIEEARDD